jgi:hypothetical protein
MFQLVTTFFCLAAVITTFFSILWGWIILGIPFVFLLIMLLGVKHEKWKYIPDLSAPANKMIQKYGHYYFKPFAGRDSSTSAIIVILASAAITMIGASKGFLWGIAIVIVTWLLMGFAAINFNPTSFIIDPKKRRAHQEIIDYIMEKRRSRRTENNVEWPDKHQS